MKKYEDMPDEELINKLIHASTNALEKEVEIKKEILKRLNESRMPCTKCGRIVPESKLITFFGSYPRCIDESYCKKNKRRK